MPVQKGTCELWMIILREIQARLMYGQSKQFKEICSPFVFLIFPFCLYLWLFVVVTIYITAPIVKQVIKRVESFFFQFDCES